MRVRCNVTNGKRFVEYKKGVETRTHVRQETTVGAGCGSRP